MKARGPFGWPKSVLPVTQGGTGQATIDAAVYALITGATNDTAPNLANDKIAWAKASSAIGRSMSFQAFWNLLNSLSSYTSPNNADELALRDGSGGGAGVRKMTLANLLLGVGYQGRNLAGRNGGLEVWQRGAGGAASISVAASTTAYTADGWALATGANQASTVAQVAGIATGSRWAARVRRTAGQTGTTAMTFEFPLDTDEIVFMQGKVVTLSMTLQAGANWSPASGNMTIELRTGTGSAAKRSAGAYTGDAAPISVTQAVTASATRYTFTSSALGASVTQASIYLTWTPVGTAGAADDFTIDDVQLEISPVATAFERRPFMLELMACQRHYWKSFAYATAPAQAVGSTASPLLLCAISAGANQVAGFVRWPVPMRVAPTTTTYNPVSANAQARDISVNADCSSTAFDNLTTEGGRIYTVGNASSVATSLLVLHAQADAGI